jgi:hypothetical protein
MDATQDGARVVEVGAACGAVRVVGTGAARGVVKVVGAARGEDKVDEASDDFATEGKVV